MIKVGSDFSGIDIWKDVPGFIRFYQVSNNGKVKRDDKILKNQLRVGYPKVTLHANGLIKQIAVHRLVAEVFIPNPENKPEVNHKDGDKTNNHKDNLEWCTSKENHKHASENNLSHFNDERNNKAKAVINIKTKEEFVTAKKAYNWYNPDYGYVYFTRKLSGEKNNETPFRYK